MSIVTSGQRATGQRGTSQRAAPGLALLLGVAWVAAAGCEAGEAVVPGLPGWSTAGAAERPWRLEAPPGELADVEARRIWTEASPVGGVSPDGRFYADQVPPAQVGIRDLETGELVRLSLDSVGADVVPDHGFNPRFSPDGRHIAFTSFYGLNRSNRDAGPSFEHDEMHDGMHLWVVDRESQKGHLAARFQSEIAYIQLQDWLPDGRTILAVANLDDGMRQIVLLSAEDGSRQVLRTLGWDPSSWAAVSPDGRWVAYDRQTEEGPSGARDVFVVAADGSQETPVVRSPSRDQVLGWTADGAHLLFSSDRGGTPGAWLLPVTEGRAAGEPVLAKADLWRIHPIQTTPDGRFFYAVEVDSPGVGTVSLDPGEGRVAGEPSRLESTLPGNGRFPAWSPDGRRLAHLLMEGSRPLGILIREVATGEIRHVPLPDSIPYAGGLAWGHRGELLLLSRVTEGRISTILEVDPRTGSVEERYRSVGSEVIYRFASDPTGDRVVAMHWEEGSGGMRNRNFRLIDLDDGSVEVVLGGPEEDPPVYRLSPALSPNGRRLAFFEHLGAEGRGYGLVVLDLETKEQTTLVEFTVPQGGGNLFGLAWAPDGRSLLYTHPVGDEESPRMRELRRIAAAGGEPESLGLAEDDLLTLAIHPDGRRLAYESGTRRWELWVLEGLPGSVVAADSNEEGGR